jgi:hypothetical protein
MMKNNTMRTMRSSKAMRRMTTMRRKRSLVRSPKRKENDP